MPKLWFACRPRPFKVPPRRPAHRAIVGDLTVVEYRCRSRVRPYGLRFEADVTTREQARSCQHQALSLAEDLDRVWMYVAGVPLFPRVMQISMIQAPNGWGTNYNRVVKRLRALGPYAVGRIRGRARSLWTLPYMPLERALTACNGYRTADEPTRLLVNLHYDAMTSSGRGSELMFLAKALELTRAILPGGNDKARQAALPHDIRSELTKPLHWLFDIANRRLEVRHVVRHPQRLELHQAITSVESSSFRREADIVLRGVVAMRLGISPAIVKREEGPSAA